MNTNAVVLAPSPARLRPLFALVAACAVGILLMFTIALATGWNDSARSSNAGTNHTQPQHDSTPDSLLNCHAGRPC